MLTASGEFFRVGVDNALDIARQKGTGVVGLIPFDSAEEPYLVVPERWERSHYVEPVLNGMPEPTAIHGLENPDYPPMVGKAVDRLNRGELDKVVLARLLEVEYEDDELQPEQIVDNLLVQQPRAFVFSVKLPGKDSYLMGASPELVFRSEEGKFTTHPLAGTVARQLPHGSTEDAQQGESLMRSAKDRAEHATVVQDIRARLSGLTEDMVVPATPSLVATPQLWHLGTRIEGKLKEGISSLDGARAIHPTPAICGFPTDSALEVIRELEEFDRGFFGGLVGWMDAEGNGEWALVLRCAEISAQHATLFAGAGIVKGSVPANEHEETANKLGSFAQALQFSTHLPSVERGQ